MTSPKSSQADRDLGILLLKQKAAHRRYAARRCELHLESTRAKQLSEQANQIENVIHDIGLIVVIEDGRRVVAPDDEAPDADTTEEGAE